MRFNRDSNVVTKGNDEPKSATSQHHSEWGAEKIRGIDASIAAKARWSIGCAATGIKITPQDTSQPWHHYKKHTGLLLIKPQGLILFCGLSVHSPKLVVFFFAPFSCTWLLFIFFPTSPLWGIATQLSGEQLGATSARGPSCQALMKLSKQDIQAGH